MRRLSDYACTHNYQGSFEIAISNDHTNPPDSAQSGGRVVHFGPPRQPAAKDFYAKLMLMLGMQLHNVMQSCA
jgi:hypothetical protein